MRNKLFGFVSVVSVLILVLTGCQKLEMSSKVSPDGSVSGAFTLKLPIAGYDLTDQELTATELMQSIDSNRVSRISYGAIDDCTLTNVTFMHSGNLNGTPTTFVFAHIAKKRTNSIFVEGTILSTDTDSNTVSAESATIVPASGKIADCANFSEIETGEFAYANAYIGGGWALGNLANPANPGSPAGLGILQLAHLPYKDRPLAVLLADFFMGQAGVEDFSEAANPELIACANYLNSKRFNVLNYDNFSSAEFKSLVNKPKIMEVSRSNSTLTFRCNYKDIPLIYLDRSVNENPEVSASSNPDGRWLQTGNPLIWNFSISSNEGREYLDVIESDPSSVIELESSNGLSSHERLIWDVLVDSGYQQTVEVSGVILDTNGTFKSKDNSVSFNDGYMFYDSDESKYYLIKDAISAEEGFMDAIIGRVVTFKEDKSTQTTKSSVISTYAKALKKKSADSIKLVGILDGTLSSDSEIASNESLVTKRLKNLKKQLKKLGVKAEISNGFVFSHPDLHGDLKAKNKVVIQIVND